MNIQNTTQSKNKLNWRLIFMMFMMCVIVSFITIYFYDQHTKQERIKLIQGFEQERTQEARVFEQERAQEARVFEQEQVSRKEKITQDSVFSERVRSAITGLSAVRAVITEHYAAYGELPTTTASQLGILMPGEWIENVEIDAIKGITAIIDPQVSNRKVTIIFKPTITTGYIRWDCFTTDLAEIKDIAPSCLYIKDN